MLQVLLIIHVCIAFALIGLVLIQHGKGADVGATFGNGASATLFGSQGSANFLSRTTAYLATAFFVINLTIVYLNNKEVHERRLIDLPMQQEIPMSTGGDASIPALNPAAPAKSEIPSNTTSEGSQPSKSSDTTTKN